MTTRDSAETVLTQLRIRESLRSVLEQEAKKNAVSLNREIVRRLEESIEHAAKLDLSAIRDDMMTAWLRFGDRFLARELEEGTIAAIEKGDYEAARSHIMMLGRLDKVSARRKAAKPDKVPRFKDVPADARFQQAGAEEGDE
jgi:hypothetical protein